MTQDHLVHHWQQRVHIERNELAERIQKLSDFIEDERYLTLPPADRVLLAKQLGAMVAYLGILDERIKRFEV